MNFTITLNGKKTIIQAQPSEDLLSVLRKEKLFSVKLGCGAGHCGSCTILYNGKPVPSCKIPVGIAMNQEIETLESFKQTEAYQDILKGFSKAGIKLCGYCNAGKIFADASVLIAKEKPTRTSIREQVEHLSPCCTDIDTLINGILYAVEAYNKRTGI